MLKSNWRSKSIQDLEMDIWPETDNQVGRLVARCAELRKVPLRQFTIEDLRLMIGQRIGLNYLVPLVIEHLEGDLFAEGDLFPGDLLQNVLNISADFWTINHQLYLEVKALIEGRFNELERENIRVHDFQQVILQHSK